MAPTTNSDTSVMRRTRLSVVLVGSTRAIVITTKPASRQMLLAINSPVDHSGCARLSTTGGFSSTAAGAFSTGCMSAISFSAIKIAPLFLTKMRLCENSLFSSM